MDSLNSSSQDLVDVDGGEQTVLLLDTNDASARAPLSSTEVERTQETMSTLDDEPEYDSIEDKYGGRYIWVVTLSAALGGLLFGYDSTVISGVLVMIKDDLGGVMTPAQEELITSITSIGAFIGALIAGIMLDKIGRKAVIGVGAVIFALGSMLQAVAGSVHAMTFGRFVVGIGIGEAAMVAPIYIAEISPAKLRGALVTVDSLAVTGGQCVAGALNIMFQDATSGWRFSVGIATVPSIILLLLCFVIPESPRALISKGKLDEACAVTQKIYPFASPEEVKHKVDSIHHQFESDHELNGLSTSEQFKLLFSDTANFRALLVACGLMAIQQLCGSNSVLYYGPTLFSFIGFGDPLRVSFVLAVTNFTFTIFAVRYIDVFGKRNFLVYSMWIMPIALFVTAAALRTLPLAGNLMAAAPDGMASGRTGAVIFISVVVFIASYAVALGNVPWQGNELFPMEVRALGTMMLTLTNWSANAMVSSSFLSLMQALTPGGTFALYGVVTLIGWLGVIYCYPEVSGLPLEDIKIVFKHGFGVAYSLKLQKDRKSVSPSQIVFTL
ncbi:general substrate transporter [Lipomyces arxii]|uniref:general substrate transporter n=1 Tax=Lipomyces arxii TaxID=56418 RepID=UPI0034CEDB94